MLEADVVQLEEVVAGAQGHVIRAEPVGVDQIVDRQRVVQELQVGMEPGAAGLEVVRQRAGRVGAEGAGPADPGRRPVPGAQGREAQRRERNLFAVALVADIHDVGQDGLAGVEIGDSETLVARARSGKHYLRDRRSVHVPAGGVAALAEVALGLVGLVLAYVQAGGTGWQRFLCSRPSLVQAEGRGACQRSHSRDAYTSHQPFEPLREIPPLHMYVSTATSFASRDTPLVPPGMNSNLTSPAGAPAAKRLTVLP